uniref:Uncharacterized protein n=1 Tax=Globodera rostochiensis TaxID=31243 RepID=A0A914HT42_GLORO
MVAKIWKCLKCDPVFSSPSIRHQHFVTVISSLHFVTTKFKCMAKEDEYVHKRNSFIREKDCASTTVAGPSVAEFDSQEFAEVEIDPLDKDSMDIDLWARDIRLPSALSQKSTDSQRELKSAYKLNSIFSGMELFDWGGMKMFLNGAGQRHRAGTVGRGLSSPSPRGDGDRTSAPAGSLPVLATAGYAQQQQQQQQRGSGAVTDTSNHVRIRPPSPDQPHAGSQYPPLQLSNVPEKYTHNDL